jgi:hypothetical protein
MIGVGEEGDGGVGGVVSMNGTYYFRDPPPAYNRAIEPFVTAGYTRAPGGGALSASLFNAGAGLNWWSAGGTGLRVEVRHHEYVREIVACSSDPNCRNWFLDFRIGVTFGR